MHWSGQLRARVTTVPRNWVEPNNLADLITGAPHAWAGGGAEPTSSQVRCLWAGGGSMAAPHSTQASVWVGSPWRLC